MNAYNIAREALSGTELVPTTRRGVLPMECVSIEKAIFPEGQVCITFREESVRLDDGRKVTGACVRFTCPADFAGDYTVGSVYVVSLPWATARR